MQTLPGAAAVTYPDLDVAFALVWRNLRRNLTILLDTYLGAKPIIDESFNLLAQDYQSYVPRTKIHRNPVSFIAMIESHLGQLTGRIRTFLELVGAHEFESWSVLGILEDLCRSSVREILQNRVLVLHPLYSTQRPISVIDCAKFGTVLAAGNEAQLCNLKKCPCQGFGWIVHLKRPEGNSRARHRIVRHSYTLDRNADTFPLSVSKNDEVLNFTTRGRVGRFIVLQRLAAEELKKRKTRPG